MEELTGNGCLTILGRRYGTTKPGIRAAS
jgi:hypothetical protein